MSSTEYEVQGNYGYGHGFETVCTETTRAEAEQRLREYRENEPFATFRIRRAPAPASNGETS